MEKKNRYDGIPEAIEKIVRAEAKKLSRYFPDELDDLEQELMLSVLDCVRWECQPKSHVRQKVKNKGADILKYMRAQCRDYRRTEGLIDGAASDENAEGEPYHAFIDLETAMEEVMGCPAPWHKRKERDLDMALLMEAMPPKLRELADAIERYSSLSEVVREMKTTRHQVTLLLEEMKPYLKKMLER